MSLRPRIEAFVGIDLAIAKKKRLPVCLSKLESGCLIPFNLMDQAVPLPPRGRGNVATLDDTVTSEFVEETMDYLCELEQHFCIAITRIAIDAPSAPRREDSARRYAEVALDRRGISCFTTPSASEFAAKREKAVAHLSAGRAESRLPAANQLWMQVGFALFARLSRRWECLEVFPQATMHVIDAAKSHKKTKAGLAAQIKAVARYAGREAFSIKTHDELDAYSSAWVASLGPNQREAFGSPPDDAIWVPIPSKLRTIEGL